MTPLKTSLIAVGLLTALTACSFRPLYGSTGEGTAARTGIQSIAVTELDFGRIGQQLRNELISQMTPRGIPAQPDYTLTVSLSDVVSDLLVQENSTVLRRNYILTASYRLIDNETGKPVFSSTARRTAALNRLDSEYANVIALRDAEERAASSIATVITQRLSIVLSELASPEKRRRAALKEAAKVAAAPQPSATPPEPADEPLSAPEGGSRTLIDEKPDTASSARFPDPVAIETAP
jgi:LPS-assembly lipoprotein